jgi:hypothetical protein
MVAWWCYITLHQTDVKCAERIQWPRIDLKCTKRIRWQRNAKKGAKKNSRACIFRLDQPRRTQHRPPYLDRQTPPSRISLQQTNPRESEREGARRKKPARSGEETGIAHGGYARGAACEDGATGAVRSVKGSEKGAYDGRMRRQRRLRSDVSPATPMAWGLDDDSRRTQHLILPPVSASSSRRRSRNPLVRGGGFHAAAATNTVRRRPCRVGGRRRCEGS